MENPEKINKNLTTFLKCNLEVPKVVLKNV